MYRTWVDRGYVVHRTCLGRSVSGKVGLCSVEDNRRWKLWSAEVLQMCNKSLENKDVHVDIDMEIGDDCSDKFDWKQNNMSPLREEG